MDNDKMVRQRSVSEQDRGEKKSSLGANRIVQEMWVWYECSLTAGTSEKQELMNERRTISASLSVA